MGAKVARTLLVIGDRDLTVESMMRCSRERAEKFGCRFTGERLWREISRLACEEAGLHSFEAVAVEGGYGVHGK
jgi:hypothetical protein